MDKRVVLLIMQVWISLALWGQTSMCGFSITKEDNLRYEGKPVELIEIVNKSGMTTKATNYAVSLAYASVPDRNGAFEPVVLGLDNLHYYWGRQPKLGATAGCFTNRIKNAEFRLDDKICYSDRNNKEHSIHGGIEGFDLQVFETNTCYITEDTAAVVFKYLSPDMEGKFPGDLSLSLAYKFTNDDGVILDYIASTDKPTIINLTNHDYFNLTGCKGPALNHCYMIMGDSITLVDSMRASTDELIPVAGAEYDFSILQTIKHHAEQLGKRYDIDCKSNKILDTLALAAKVVGPVSGRVLKAYTTESGIRFYTPASDLSHLKATGSLYYRKYFGSCLEIQHFPDSPHHVQFPTTVLLPGETYRQTTIYKLETL